MTKLPIAESYWVEENRFLAGEYPGSRDPETARRLMDAFLEAGITAFIDLTESHELTPYEGILKEQAKNYGVNVSHQRIPIRDLSVPSSDTMTTILNAIDKATNNGDCVYVHCWGGIGRTGMVVGCYLIRHGNTNEQAIEKVNRLYKTRPADLRHPRSPETDEQVEFVRNWWDDPNDLSRNLKYFCEG
jgi:protein-tyrosine phosphatase